MNPSPRPTIIVCLLWTTACVASSGGGDDTGSTTATPTTNDTIDDPSATAESSSSSATTDTSGTDTSTSATTGDAGAMSCGLRCETAADCCVLSGSFGCEDQIGIYPDNFVCGPGGTCSNRGCASTDECSVFDSQFMQYVCVTREVFSTCEVSCVDDGDCSGAGASYACTGDDARVGGYCEPPQCSNDAECIDPGEQCIDGDCVFSCTADEHCGGNGTCDLASGDCVCAGDDGCLADWGCAPAP